MAHAAVFLDYENIYYSLANQYEDVDTLFFDVINASMSELEQRTESLVIMRRVYAPFSSHRFANSVDELALQGFSAVHVIADEHKNSSDLMLAVDVIETLYTKPNVDVFLIIGGDRDFIPIVGKLKEAAKKVFVCSMPGSLSGDLASICGVGNVINPVSLVGSSKFVDKRKSTPPPSPVPKVDKKISAQQDDDEIDEISKEECLNILVEAHAMVAEFDNPEIWLSPFLRRVRQLYPLKDNRVIRKALKQMENAGIWEIVEKPSDRPGIESFSVLLLNWNHGLVAQSFEEYQRR